MLDFNEVSFSYDSKNFQLEKVTAHIPKGQVTTILGPNGSGKSTLLKTVAKAHLPTEGAVLLRGEDIATCPMKQFARRVAVVYQQNEAPSDITVEHLVSYGRIPYQERFRGMTCEDEEAVDWALSVTGLEGKRHHPVYALSGGERQRVWIALALAQKTPILLLDEPTTYLDLYYQYDLLDLIQSLNVQYGLTVVMVLHDLNQAFRYSDTVLVMKEGRLVANGPPERALTEERIYDVYGIQMTVRYEDAIGWYTVPLKGR